MDAQKRRQLQYFKQRHAQIPVNPDSAEFLERFEDADATRERILQLQRGQQKELLEKRFAKIKRPKGVTKEQFKPTKDLIKAQKKRAQKQKKGAKSNLRGEVAQL